MLAHFGFDVSEAQYHSAPMAARYDAVSAGRVDAAQISEPFLGRFIKEGGTVWIEPREVLPNHQYSVFAFGPRLLEEDRELGRRVTLALLKGIRAFNLGKTPRNVQILADAIGWEPDLLEDACWPQFRDDGGINVESIAEFQAWAFARGELDAIVSPSEYMDTTFVQYARRQLDGSE
jgi:ABC-type nitrate/sulfonate/bicarbonate transport system substrate-binding protein